MKPVRYVPIVLTGLLQFFPMIPSVLADDAAPVIARPDWQSAVENYLASVGIHDFFQPGQSLRAIEVGGGRNPVAHDLFNFDLRMGPSDPPLAVADGRNLPLPDGAVDVVFTDRMMWTSIAFVRQDGIDRHFRETRDPSAKNYYSGLARLGWSGGVPQSLREFSEYLRLKHQNIKDLIAETSRVLRPRGVLFMTFSSRWAADFTEEQWLRYFSEQVKAARRHGFTSIHVRPGSLLLPKSGSVPFSGLAFVRGVQPNLCGENFSR